MLKRHPERIGRQRTPARFRASARWLAAACALSVLGCPDEDLAPLEPCTVSGVSKDVPVGGVDKVDVLFVIDNSGSMKEEQEKLAERLPDLVRILTSGRLPNGETFPPVADLHLGVVSTDMGASGVRIGQDGCDHKELYQDGRSTSPVVGQKEGNPGFGDDGILISRSRDTSCNNFSLNNTNYLTYIPAMANGVTPDQVANNFRCLASLGTNGCGFEQQLEAMLKALAPSSDTSFGQNTGGHGTGRNQGFLREDAVLAVIHVSDEEDCSITSSGAELFIRTSTNPNVMVPGTSDRIGLNLRCAFRENPGDDEARAEKVGMIHPVQRYIDGLLKLKPNNPDRIIFAAIVGIPEELENASYDDILNSPKMNFAVDQTTGRGILTDDATAAQPACYGLDDAGNVNTAAMPGIRFVKVAKGLNGIVKSICAKSYEGALNTIIEKISLQLSGSCLPRPLAPNAAGVVECDVVEILGPTASPQDCDAARGRVFLEMRRHTDGSQRVVCAINQVAVQVANGRKQLVPNENPLPGVRGDIGWYYDDFTQEMQDQCPENQQHRISFNPREAEPKNSTIRFECFQPVARSDSNAVGKEAVNAPCLSDNDCRSDNVYQLTCEPSSRTCQIVCQADAMCPPSWVCDKAVGLCTNPTCPPPTVN